MSFQQALSGLNATAQNLNIIGNNIANANTYGSKSARAEFSDVYASALNGSGTQAIGIGTTLSAVAQQFTQGNITTTENPMDLAISGNGFFQVQAGNGDDQTGPILYTRNGQFKVDKDGYIVNNAGLRLRGADGALKLPSKEDPFEVTDEVKMEMNLDQRSKPVPASVPKIDFDNSNDWDATSQTLYGPLGVEVVLTYFFQKKVVAAGAPEEWDVFAKANGVPIPGTGTAAAPEPITTLTFNSFTGVLDAVSDGTFSLPDHGFTDPITMDFEGTTQFASAFGVTKLSQDGNSTGKLTGIKVESSGVVTATYSNGEQSPAGQIKIATFTNPQGLQPVGGNAWAATAASDQAIVGNPGEGNAGLLQAGALEESNVDLTAELVNMITAQRSYQANAQTIKTQDQVLQTLLNLR